VALTSFTSNLRTCKNVFHKILDIHDFSVFGHFTPMQFRTESGESERHWILLIFTENLKKSNEKDSEDTPVQMCPKK
jgi:hypothetical protein